MRKLLRCGLLGAALGLAGACEEGSSGGESACTLDLRAALVINVTPAPGEALEDVELEHEVDGEPNECRDTGSRDGMRTFQCFERGAGTYLVRVRSGDREETQAVDLALDAAGCHVRDTHTMTFELSTDAGR